VYGAYHPKTAFEKAEIGPAMAAHFRALHKDHQTILSELVIFSVT
jgi:hypothetical protein